MDVRWIAMEGFEYVAGLRVSGKARVEGKELKGALEDGDQVGWNDLK